MTEHLTETAIELYRRGQDDAATRQRTAAHLAACEHCLRSVYPAEHSALAVKALSEAFLPSLAEDAFHLSPADLKSYFSGHAAEADRLICESHTEICEACSEELRVLSATQSAAIAKVNTATTGGLTWLRLGWWTGTPLRIATAVALIALLAVGLVLLRRRMSNPAPQLANNGSQQAPGSSVPVVPSNNPPTGEKPASASFVVLLKDNGKEIGLDAQGKPAGLEGLDESTQRIVKNALAGEPPARPKLLDELAPQRITLMGESPDENTFQLIRPLGEIITETRPTLRWKKLNGAMSYVASVFDSKFNLVARSAPLSQPAWPVSVPLHRGQNYFWEVKAIKEGTEVIVPVSPAPRAQFRILEAEKLKALQNLQRQKPNSHLALGLTYARFGLVKDAEGEFQQLLKENPESTTVKQLLRTIQTWR